jgi:hypothetical protein
MPHVIEPFTNATFNDALYDLRAANAFIVERAKMSLAAADGDVGRWGISLKRTPVDLTGDLKPRLIGKASERLGEVINIVATVERLIAAIEWFSRDCPKCNILECHPSTSDETNGNDLVLIDDNGTVVVRCEVCDVASSSGGSNGKEKKDIRNLGCSVAVPDDQVRRYICTSPEFATALTSTKRKWLTMAYQYEQTAIGDAADCRLLLILPNGK